jgi:hypothetical protein
MSKYLRKTVAEHPRTAYPRPVAARSVPLDEEAETMTRPLAGLGAWSGKAFPLRANAPDGYRAEIAVAYPHGYTGTADEAVFDWSVRHDNGQIKRGRGCPDPQTAKLAAAAGLLALRASRGAR